MGVPRPAVRSRRTRRGTSRRNCRSPPAKKEKGARAAQPGETSLPRAGRLACRSRGRGARAATTTQLSSSSTQAPTQVSTQLESTQLKRQLNFKLNSKCQLNSSVNSSELVNSAQAQLSRLARALLVLQPCWRRAVTFFSPLLLHSTRGTHELTSGAEVRRSAQDTSTGEAAHEAPPSTHYMSRSAQLTGASRERSGARPHPLPVPSLPAPTPHVGCAAARSRGGVTTGSTSSVDFALRMGGVATRAHARAHAAHARARPLLLLLRTRTKTLIPSHNLFSLSLSLSHFTGDTLDGGAYPLSTVDIIAIAAVVYLVTVALRSARNYLERPPPRKPRKSH